MQKETLKISLTLVTLVADGDGEGADVSCLGDKREEMSDAYGKTISSLLIYSKPKRMELV